LAKQADKSAARRLFLSAFYLRQLKRPARHAGKQRISADSICRRRRICRLLYLPRRIPALLAKAQSPLYSQAAAPRLLAADRSKIVPCPAEAWRRQQTASSRRRARALISPFGYL